MPLLNQSSVAAMTVNSAVLNLQQELSFAVQQNTVDLYVDQLPNLVFWAVQTGGATPCSFVPQAALRNTNNVAGGTMDLDYLDLSGSVVMPALNTPILLNFQFPANFIRIEFTPASGVATTVKFVLAGYAP